MYSNPLSVISILSNLYGRHRRCGLHLEFIELISGVRRRIRLRIMLIYNIPPILHPPPRCPLTLINGIYFLLQFIKSRTQRGLHLLILIVAYYVLQLAFVVIGHYFIHRLN